MATADELLSNVFSTVPEHTHPVVDSDSYYVIDPVTRLMENSSQSENILMENDHDSERYTFELPRYVDGHDMMLCNRVRVHYMNYSEETGVIVEDVYDCDDLHIDESNPQNVLCTWLISRQATQQPGVLSFLVEYLCTMGDGTITYEWHTDIYSNVIVKPGRNNAEVAIIEYTDVLEQWRARLFGTGESAVNSIIETFDTKQAELLECSNEQQANIEAKGAATLETIPEDYITTHNMADEALRRKSDAIIVNDSGEHIFLDDTSDCNLVGLNLYGRTTQVSTTGSNILDPSNISSEILNDKGDLRNGIYVPITETGTYTYHVSGDETTYLGVADSLSVNAICIATSLKASPANGTVELTTGQYFVLWFSPGKEVSSTNLYFLGLGSILPYEPYTAAMATPNPQYTQPLNDIESPTVRIYGSNLLNVDEMFNDTFVENADGSYTITKTDTGRFSKQVMVKIPAGIRGVLHYEIVGFNNTDNVTYPVSLQLSYSDTTTKSIGLYDGQNITKFVCDKNVEWVRLFISGGEPSGTYVTIKNMWMEIESAESEYESYKPVQSMSSVRTLRGIPVTSGGNYIDLNGQHWICDEIDYERGKFIQRIVALTLDGTQTFGINNYQLTYTGGYAFETYVAAISGKSIEIPVMSTHLPRRLWAAYAVNKNGVYATAGRILINFEDQQIKTVEELSTYLQSNPIDVLYERDEPIETDLTPAELEAFKALKTNATNTTILNDQNAMMSVKYLADIKRYIYKNVNTHRKFDLTLSKSKWVEHDNGMYYSQVVDMYVRDDIKIDLHPTAEQLISLIQDGISMFASNENGVVTVYAIGGVPDIDMSIRATEQVVYYV